MLRHRLIRRSNRPGIIATAVIVCALLAPDVCTAQPSVARRWDEAILDAIRIDTPRPPVHARNLYHLSAAMYDAWAAFDPIAKGTFVHEKHSGDAAARNEAISYAAYRILTHRYSLSVNAAASKTAFDGLLQSLGYDKNVTTTVGDSPAALGNRIAQRIIDSCLHDGANEANNYRDTSGWTPVNAPMIVSHPTATDQSGTPLADPNRWQQLYINSLTAQNGVVLPSSLQGYVCPQWGPVTPFAMQSAGPFSWSDLDPGAPPQLGGVGSAIYREQAVDLIRKSRALDPSHGAGAALINISPSVHGNRALGTSNDQGYAANPVTGQPYADNPVKVGDYGRVLAEFWADGPHSETPPGHWNVIANSVSDDPRLVKRIGGAGDVVDDLEWDVKMYLTLNGAVHDAAIAAWGVKRKYESPRPITMIRYLGSQGQSSDPTLPSYNAKGLPLEADLIELATAESIASGGRHRNAYLLANLDHNGDFFPFFDESYFVGKVVLHAWNHAPDDPATQTSGADWILAEHWLPYQMETFVTPAFPGYVSGHSTFSRSAAEVLTSFTGSPYFPGGLAEATFTPDYLKFEDGPTQPVTLQWVSYFDAADEAGLSRQWGGIHPAMDDFPGRIMGAAIGQGAFRRASQLFQGVPEPTAIALAIACCLSLLSARRK